MSAILGSAVTGAGGGAYTIDNSVRLRESASAYLSRTPASSSGTTTWTCSFWVKRGEISNIGRIMTAGSSISDTFGFLSNDTFQFYYDSTGQNLITTQVFRDPSAWYHFVIVNDTTQATSSNRCKIYVNGSQVTALATATYPAQNAAGSINSNVIHNIGRRPQTGGELFDGYLAEFYMISGTALTPSSFGETNASTGVWQPKAYSGSYGTNGFYLKFSDIATTSGSNAGLGKDFSGNGNYWTTNNISVTSGTTYDAMTDSPTPKSSTVGNYCVMNPLAKSSGVTAAGGNLNVTSSTQVQAIAGTMYANSGKWYAEFTCNSNGTEDGVGILQDTFNFSQSGFYQSTQLVVLRTSTDIYYSTSSGFGSSTWVSGDVIQVKLDLDNQTVGWAKNGGSYTTATITSYDGHTAGQYWTFGVRNGSAGGSGSFNYSVNLGQRPFVYSVPSGFNRLQTYNLPTPTIGASSTTLAGNYFNVGLYTGTGSSSPLAVSGANTPDFVWIKVRSASYSHSLLDKLRSSGTPFSLRLYSNNANSEYNYGSSLLTPTSTGFNLTTSDPDHNNSGQTYVAWQWEANGAGVTNTAGSITSTVSANTTAGFSIVKWTGTGSSGTTGHGLGAAPKIIILKDTTNAYNWYVFTTATGSNLRFEGLNNTNASTSQPSQFTTTSTLIENIPGIASLNTSGATMIAYCFAEKTGFSKIGSYTGNNSSDGPFIYCGFRPRYVMTKLSSSSGGDWAIIDTARNTYNISNTQLWANSTSGDNSTVDCIDILSNGFKVKASGITNFNQSGATYIYMAFAESPFNYSLAR